MFIASHRTGPFMRVYLTAGRRLRADAVRFGEREGAGPGTDADRMSFVWLRRRGRFGAEILVVVILSTGSKGGNLDCEVVLDIKSIASGPIRGSFLCPTERCELMQAESAIMLAWGSRQNHLSITRSAGSLPKWTTPFESRPHNGNRV